MVDRRERPLVVYHGTFNSDFSCLAKKFQQDGDIGKVLLHGQRKTGERLVTKRRSDAGIRTLLLWQDWSLIC